MVGKKIVIILISLCIAFIIQKLYKNPQKVRIVHEIRKGGTLESVRKHGLLTRKELFKRGLITEPLKSEGVIMVDHYDVIYFSYDYYSEDNPNRVSLEVDPYTTYVYNREYRYYNDPKNYYASKILLSTYIANKEKAQKMQQRAPEGKGVIFDPITSKPFYVNDTDERYSKPFDEDIIDVYDAVLKENYPKIMGNSIYLYPGEIIINRKNIPPEELIFHD